MSPLLWIPGRSLAGHIVPTTQAEIRARRGARGLHGMSDRMLADIGIGRGQIEGAVRGRSRHARGG